MLKTLEEPPGNACLILVTSSAERLLPTIRSRCQRVPFDLLPPDYVEAQLRALADVAPEAARTLAALAQGRLGAALHWHKIGLLTALAQVSQALANGLAEQPTTFAKTLLEIANELAIRTVDESGNFAEEPFNDPENGETARSKPGARTIETDQLRAALKLVLLLIGAIYREALIVRSASQSALRALPPELNAVDTLAADADADQLAERIQAVATSEYMLDRNVAPQLACERLAIALTGELSGL